MARDDYVQIVMPREMRAAFDELARARRVPRSMVLREALAFYLDSLPGEPTEERETFPSEPPSYRLLQSNGDGDD